MKWFNVKSGYGFINRNDTKEDVFVHQVKYTFYTNIIRYERREGNDLAEIFDVALDN